MLQNIQRHYYDDGGGFYSATMGGREWSIPLEGHRWSVICKNAIDAGKTEATIG